MKKRGRGRPARTEPVKLVSFHLSAEVIGAIDAAVAKLAHEIGPTAATRRAAIEWLIRRGAESIKNDVSCVS